MDNNQPPLNTDELIKIAEWLLKSPPVEYVSKDAIRIEKKDGQRGGAKKRFLDAIDKYFEDIGVKEVKRGDWTVKITRSGIASSLEHGYRNAKINAFAAIPQVIKQGKIIKENKNWKGRRYDSYIIDAPILIGGTDYLCEIIVNHHPDGTFTFYLHEVEEKAKLLSAFTSGYNTSAPEGASKLNISKLLISVKHNISFQWSV